MTARRETQPPGAASVIAAVFAERNRAEDALRDLREHGFRPEAIGVAMRNPGEARELAQTIAETELEEGAVIGAVAGGALGGLAGWLLAVGVIAVPGVGPILAAGPLAVALGGLAIGAATGSLVGALAGEGIPEESARWYERAVRGGAVLVTVRSGERAAEVRDILTRHGGLDAPEEEGRRPGERVAAAASPAGPPIHLRSELVPEGPISVSIPVTETPALPETVVAGTFYGPLPAATPTPPETRERPEPVPVVRREDERETAPPAGPQPEGRQRESRSGRETTLETTLESRGESRSMSEVRVAMREMTGAAQETMRGVREGEPSEVLGGFFSFLESIPNSTYYFGMIGSIAASLWLFVAGKRWESLFVGLWAPTIITSSLFYKLLRPSREARHMR